MNTKSKKRTTLSKLLIFLFFKNATYQPQNLKSKTILTSVRVFCQSIMWKPTEEFTANLKDFLNGKWQLRLLFPGGKKNLIKLTKKSFHNHG